MPFAPFEFQILQTPFANAFGMPTARSLQPCHDASAEAISKVTTAEAKAAYCKEALVNNGFKTLETVPKGIKYVCWAC